MKGWLAILKTELKTRWVSALRSRYYEQGTGYLRNNDKHCCLGVLCDILANDGIGEWKGGDDFYYNGEPYRSALTNGTEALAEFVGLDKKTQDVLINLNDNNANFNTIATVIEGFIQGE